MRRSFVVLCAAATAVIALWTSPAAAAAPSVRITTPGAGAVISDSTPNVAGDAQMSDGDILEIVATISSAEGHPVPGAHRVAGDGRPSVAFSWTPSLSYNGNYSVSVRASGEDQPIDTNGTEESETSRSFAVEAPPAVPREVVVRADQDSREVDVTWRENVEPDLLGYQVQRSVDDSEWSVAGESGEAFFRDTSSSSAGGTYNYRVVAVRSGASSDSGVASAPSEEAGTAVPSPPGGDRPSDSAGGDDTGPSGDGSPGSSGTSGSGGSGSGSSGSGSAPGSSGSSGARPPAISRGGRVDLSGFGSLLDQTRAPNAQPLPESDAGFAEDLPFEPRTIEEEIGGEEVAVPEGGFSGEGSDRAELLRFFAAGLLVTVILMHVLWLRGEVEKVPLEALPVTER